MRTLLLVFSCFFCLLNLTGTVNAKTSERRTFRLRKAVEQVLSDHFQSDAFKASILQIVADPVQADVLCQVKFGPFYYFSYTGKCESCSVHCSSPTDGMKKECLEHCKDFMTNQALKDEQLLLKSKIKKLEDDLETTNERLDEVEADFIEKFYGLLSGFVFVVLVIVVILLLFGRHVKQKYARRPPRDVNPTGDNDKGTGLNPGSQCSGDSGLGNQNV
ncbi:uncharacterized protein LOC143462393 [Clavelina lepadiformis]|uniref:uncharacterized protein LOC143462393 n=1 Tax=Clavelina lepadiformis TaxID=159417 RepID=UPI004042C58D